MLLCSMEGIPLIVEILIKFLLWFFRRNAHITSILGDRKKNRLIWHLSKILKNTTVISYTPKTLPCFYIHSYIRIGNFIRIRGLICKWILPLIGKHVLFFNLGYISFPFPNCVKSTVLFFENRDFTFVLNPQSPILGVPTIRWRLHKCWSISSHDHKRNLTPLNITDTGLCS